MVSAGSSSEPEAVDPGSSSEPDMAGSAPRRDADAHRGPITGRTTDVHPDASLDGGAAVAFDAVVLAGGTARRLDGVSKPDVELHGRRLLDHALAATAGASRVVVVAPDSVEVPVGVLRTLEDPPYGGPVAGIAAGLMVLGDAAPAVKPSDTKAPGDTAAARSTTTTGAAPGGIAAVTAPAPWVLVLACDVPFAARAVPRLLAAATNQATASRDGACLRDDSGYLQWLVGVYRTDSLQAALAGLGRRARGASVRALVAPLSVASVAATGQEALDVDTWADLDSLDD